MADISQCQQGAISDSTHMQNRNNASPPWSSLNPQPASIRDCPKYPLRLWVPLVSTAIQAGALLLQTPPANDFSLATAPLNQTSLEARPYVVVSVAKVFLAPLAILFFTTGREADEAANSSCYH